MTNISALVRATLIVSDLERSKAFYSRVLGLTEVYMEGTIADGNTHELLGAPAGTVIKVCILNKPDAPAYGMIGLCEMNQPRPARMARSGAGVNIGEFCLVFYCDDLDRAAADVTQQGLTITFGPAPLHSGGQLRYRGISFHGPDEERISLFEWAPDRAQSGDRPEQWVGRQA